MTRVARWTNSFLGPGLGVVLSTGCASTDPVDPRSSLEGIAKIVFDSTAKRVYPPGTTITLASLAYAVPDTGGAAPLPAEGLTWRVSNTSVIQVGAGSITTNGVGTAYLIVSWRDSRDSIPLQVVKPYSLTAVVSLDGVVDQIVYGVTSMGWIAYAVRIGSSWTYHLWRGGRDDTPDDCEVRGINDLGQILCRTASGRVELIQGANRTALSGLVGFAPVGFSSAGDVTAVQSDCTISPCDSVVFRRATGETIRRRAGTLCSCVLFSTRAGTNVFGDFVLTATGIYLNSAIWRPIEGDVRQLSGFGRWSGVSGMNDARTLVGSTESPVGSNQARPIVWRYDGSVWRTAAVAREVTGSAADVSNADLVVGVMGSQTAFLWSATVLGPPTPVDDLLNDDSWTVNNAFRIASDARIVARATMKSSGAKWLVLLTPESP